MKLHELAPPEGAKKSRKRVGRGNGSGHGTFSGRGQKGQKARSGPGIDPRFEGGQSPLVLRLPYKRGFQNRFKQFYWVVNVARLEKEFDAETEITPEVLVKVGLVRDSSLPVKLLGNGELTKRLTVKVNKWSRSAQQKIEAAGGTVEAIA